MTERHHTPTKKRESFSLYTCNVTNTILCKFQVKKGNNCQSKSPTSRKLRPRGTLKCYDVRKGSWVKMWHVTAHVVSRPHSLFGGSYGVGGEAGGRPEPEKREKTERETKTTLDNEKLHTQSIGSKLSIYCEQTLERAAKPRGAETFFHRPSHTGLFSRATSCVTSNDSSKWRACSQDKIWLTSPRVPHSKQHMGDANSETINELTLKCFADPGYQRLRNGKHRASCLSSQGRKQRSEILCD